MSFQPDVIIVGGGTSGSVLAARLSADPARKVLLLEAGADHFHYPDSVRHAHLAARNVLAGGKHKIRWLRRMPGNVMPTILLRGNVLGGTSAINYMAAVRGMPEDFDAWQAAGCDGWGWQSVLPHFRALENDTDFGETALHGAQGPLRIRRWPVQDFQGVHRAFYQGLRELDIAASDDINDRRSLPGVGAFTGTVSDAGHTLLSVSQAYLTNAVRQRPNLQIRTQAPVARVIIEQQRVRGVQLCSGEVLAAPEVVLSCGAFESPKLLMLSGIGDPQQLTEHGIQVQHTLPAVGRRLQDHVAISLLYRAPYRGPHHGSPAQSIWIGASDGDNLDFHAMPSPVINTPLAGEIANLMVFNLQPHTQGQVRLRSANPAHQPLLDLNFLTATEDLESIARPMKTIAQWEQTAAFKAWGAKRLFPRKIPRTAEQVKAAKRWLSISYFHHVGTCAMGPEGDEHSVVDTRCRVQGVQGLRVVDASVMPTIIRGNTYLCCVMVAEKIAAEWPLP